MILGNFPYLPFPKGQARGEATDRNYKPTSMKTDLVSYREEIIIVHQKNQTSITNNHEQPRKSLYPSGEKVYSTEIF